MWRVGKGFDGCGNTMCECGGIGHQMWHAIQPCMVNFSPCKHPVLELC